MTANGSRGSEAAQPSTHVVCRRRANLVSPSRKEPMTTTENIETALTPISEARRMLAQASTLPELRNLRDYATGAKAWAKARGMGIDAENEATEVILRAERGIGESLIHLKNEGRFGVEASGAARSRMLKGKSREDFGGGSLSDGSGTFITLADLGLNSVESYHFQRLASLEDERFEAMIRSVRSIEGARLAKANFYAALDKAERKRTGVPSESNEIGLDPGFGAFLTARNALLGWEVHEDGTEGPTKNGLLSLADDQLRTLALGLKALAVAYDEARRAR